MAFLVKTKSVRSHVLSVLDSVPYQKTAKTKQVKEEAMESNGKQGLEERGGAEAAKVTYCHFKYLGRARKGHLLSL